MRNHESNGSAALAGFLGEEALRRQAQPVLGVVEGEGVGPEVMRCALDALAALQEATGLRVEVRRADRARPGDGRGLAEAAAALCREVFAAGGAVLSGPEGGRFVYDLRRSLDLFCKLSPIRVHGELLHAGPFRPDHAEGVELFFVRDNAGGVYQGEWDERVAPDGSRVAAHHFAYTERQVRRVAEVATRLAAARQGRLTVVVKHGGVPGISRLWCDVTGEVATRRGVAWEAINGDHAAYRILREPRAFDVILTPNLLGDLLIDEAAVLQGSRALAFSGNYAGDGAAVYQTNHGSALDLAGKDLANPAGQILALAMLLRESLRRPREAAILEGAVAEAWRAGYRTPDLAEPGRRTVGTREFGRLVTAFVAQAARESAPARAAP